MEISTKLSLSRKTSIYDKCCFVVTRCKRHLFLKSATNGHLSLNTMSIENQKPLVAGNCHVRNRFASMGTKIGHVSGFLFEHFDNFTNRNSTSKCLDTAASLQHFADDFKMHFCDRISNGIINFYNQYMTRYGPRHMNIGSGNGMSLLRRKKNLYSYFG